MSTYPLSPGHRVLRCRFLTVPDPAAEYPDRLVVCNRIPSKHPVTGQGYFVNHQYPILGHPSLDPRKNPHLFRGGT